MIKIIEKNVENFVHFFKCKKLAKQDTKPKSNTGK